MKRDSAFVYDEECLKALIYKRIDSSEVWHHRSTSESSAAANEATVKDAVGKSIKAVSSWSELEKLPNILDSSSLVFNCSMSTGVTRPITGPSQSQLQNAVSTTDINILSQGLVVVTVRAV